MMMKPSLNVLLRLAKERVRWLSSGERKGHSYKKEEEELKCWWEIEFEIMALEITLEATIDSAVNSSLLLTLTRHTACISGTILGWLRSSVSKRCKSKPFWNLERVREELISHAGIAPHPPLAPFSCLICWQQVSARRRTLLPLLPQSFSVPENMPIAKFSGNHSYAW